MAKTLLFTFLLTLTFQLSFGQSIDSLKLSDTEIPAGYSKSDKLICATPHAYSFYEQVSLSDVPWCSTGLDAAACSIR